jgi:hypothetical protein
VRLVLSRKGFDSSTGRVPSPILEGGTLLPLPIPSRSSPVTYGEISVRGRPLARIVRDLTPARRKVEAHFGAHLDPDLDRASLPRRRGWRPLFGQCDAAQGVLESHGVGPGDLFLFFGWFRRAEEREGVYRYGRGAENLHVLFGWLQVGKVIRVGEDPVPAWAAYHPHFDGVPRRKNTLYVARRRLRLGGEELAFPGGGLFGQLRPELRLTAPGAGRSVWRLPGWFHPGEDRPPLGAHGNRERWSREGGFTRLATVPRGQEFVLDLDAYPEAHTWLRSLLSG